MEASIYKLNVPKDFFIDYLIERGMSLYGKEVTMSFSKNIDENTFSNDVTAQFYFKKESKDKEINWYSFWADFFGSESNVKKTIESAYGVILIEISNSLYGISLGIGYHYANNHSLEDFGFKIAEKIIKENAITLKAVKFFQQTKNRSLTQYHSTFAVNEVGESNELVIGKLEISPELNEFKIKDYTDEAVFGTAVKLNVNEYNQKEILELVSELHIIFYEMKNLVNFPRLKPLPNNEHYDNVKSCLDKKLLDDLIEENDNTSLSYFTERDGNIVVYSLHSEVSLAYNYKSKDARFNIKSIGNTLELLECKDICNRQVILNTFCSLTLNTFRLEYRFPIFDTMTVSI